MYGLGRVQKSRVITGLIYNAFRKKGVCVGAMCLHSYSQSDPPPDRHWVSQSILGYIYAIRADDHGFDRVLRILLILGRRQCLDHFVQLTLVMPTSSKVAFVQ